VSEVDSGARLAVGGDLDIATADQLVVAAEERLAISGNAELTLDLAGVRFCDSAGINALVRVRRLCDERGGRLQVVNPQLAVRRVLEFAGLTAHLNLT